LSAPIVGANRPELQNTLHFVSLLAPSLGQILAAGGNRDFNTQSRLHAVFAGSDTGNDSGNPIHTMFADDTAKGRP
jgi:hypothetical protein